MDYLTDLIILILRPLANWLVDSWGLRSTLERLQVELYETKLTRAIDQADWSNYHQVRKEFLQYCGDNNITIYHVNNISLTRIVSRTNSSYQPDQASLVKIVTDLVSQPALASASQRFKNHHIFHMACLNCQPAIVKVFLAAGAEITLPLLQELLVAAKDQPDRLTEVIILLLTHSQLDLSWCFIDIMPQSSHRLWRRQVVSSLDYFNNNLSGLLISLDSLPINRAILSQGIDFSSRTKAHPAILQDLETHQAINTTRLLVSLGLVTSSDLTSHHSFLINQLTSQPD